MTAMAGKLRLSSSAYVRISYRVPDWEEDRPDETEVIPEDMVQVARQQIEAEGGRVVDIEEVSWQAMLARMENGNGWE